METHLGILSRVRTGRCLTTRVGIYLSIKYEHLDVHPRSQHTGQRLEANNQTSYIGIDLGPRALPNVINTTIISV